MFHIVLPASAGRLIVGAQRPVFAVACSDPSHPRIPIATKELVETLRNTQSLDLPSVSIDTSLYNRVF
jgi:hypothetical protein